jgi:glutaredoxin-like protein NrdH
MTVITVYTKPACPQCTATLRALRQHGIPHRTVDLTADPDARDFVLALGYLAAPVIYVGPAEHFSGFRPDRIAALAAA